ncbi:ABC transporter ATP-binding protein [Micromonospora sp. NPDC050686]|uniref:ABC transporter ATP-binding protein n=1 Tax=Micromonospora sp. NPDC050686 TaxID=3154631 RepID=UPI003409C37F
MPERVRELARGYAIAAGFGFRAARGLAIAQLLLAVGLAVVPPATLYATKLCLDAVISGDAASAYRAGVGVGAGVAVIVLLIFYYTRAAFGLQEWTNRLADRELMHLMGGATDLGHFEHPEYLNQTHRIREDRWTLSNGVSLTATWVRSFVSLVLIGVLMGRVHPLLLTFPLFAVLSIMFAHRASMHQIRAHEATSEQERLRRHLFGVATSPASAKELRVFASTRALRRRHLDVGRVVVAERNRAQWKAARLDLREGLISTVGMLIGIAFTVALASGGDATGGDVLLVVGLGATLGGSIGGLVQTTIQLILAARTGMRVDWLRRYAGRPGNTGDGKTGSGAVEQSAEPAVPAPARLRRGIDLNGVSFQYPGAARPVLDNVRVLLPPGATVALVGPNGAGKTTLVKLLLGFLRPTVGHIALDGVDLTRLDPDDWRTRITAAFQDHIRFEFVAREAVGIGDLAQAGDDSAVYAALHRAGATSLVDDLPAGLDTRLGSRWHHGVELSGGQWQQVALGRGQMRRQPLLAVFDEPTAALDPETEQELFDRLAQSASANRQRGTVTVIISHRFSTVAMADLILVLDDGRLVEVGTHGELMDRGGTYAEQFNLQARAYR